MKNTSRPPTQTGGFVEVHENLKLITDERVIEENPEIHSGSMSSMKNLDDTYNFGDQFLYEKPTKDDQEKSKVIEESDSTMPNPSHQTVTSTPLVIAPFTEFSYPKPSSLVTPPPINTEATTITTSLPEITLFIALQLRVARLEQEMPEVKKTDYSADVLASIKSQVPTAVDEYLGTKLDDALLKILERHTTDLIEKYSVLPGLESVENQESEKSPKEIIRAKKEQGEEKQDSTYSINHKRKHDSNDDEDDDDDEGPSAGSNQGKSSKRRRHDSGASGSAQPPTKDDEQSSKKPRESDTESEHSEQSSDDIPMQDEGHVSDLEDTDNAHVPKVSTTTWFKPIPEGERPATPEQEWTIPPNDFPEPENNWANTYATARTRKEEALQAELESSINLNPEGHQILRNIYEPLPLGGPPGQLIAACYLDFGPRKNYSIFVGEVNVIYIMRSMHHSRGGLRGERNYTSTNTLSTIVKQSIADANSHCDQCQGVRKIRIQLPKRDNSSPS
ncbi:hypothetical protein Tco_1040185 [Tanacetum coccineum]